MSINLTLKATGSCPYWAFFDPSAISNLLLVDENHILDHFPEYLAQLQVACDSHKVILLHPYGYPYVLVVAGESIDGILQDGRYQQVLAGSFVALPSGSLICSVVNKMATVSNESLERRRLETKSIASEIPRAHHRARVVLSVGRTAGPGQSAD